MKQLPLKLSLNPHSTFDGFFVSSHNAIVRNTLQQFLIDDSESFLYLWSQPGDGITHLLEAAQNAVIQTLSCQYLPLKELLHYPPEAITEGLEQLDLICLDDIEAIANHPQWQQALFHLYNQLRDNGKKLIVGAHSAPRQLTLELQDLKSRLQWGAVLYIEPLNDEEKKRALQKKAQNLGMNINEEVLHFLLTRIERSNSALYKVLALLDQESIAEKRKLTIPFVKQVLQRARLVAS